MPSNTSGQRVVEQKRRRNPEPNTGIRGTTPVVAPSNIFSFVPRTDLSEFNRMFPHGIPDGISTFITEIIDEKVVPAVDHEFPVDALNNIFSYLPKFSKKEYKVLLLGDGGVGKEEYVNTLKDLFDYDTLNSSAPSLVAEDVVALKMNTNYGAITFNLWNIAGQEKYEFLRDGSYNGADCAIIMFDLTSRITKKNIPFWRRDVSRVCGNIPIVLCGSKFDIKDRKVKAKQIKKNNIPYYDISAKLKYNVEKPFLFFAKSLVGEHDLCAKTKFLPFPAPYPPLPLPYNPLPISGSTNSQQLQAAAAQPLPEDDDDDL